MDPEVLKKLAIDKLNKTKPLHQYQRDILKNFFCDKPLRVLMLNCGRKMGKTETSIYFLIRSALETPKGTFYYVAPTGSQGEEICWQRLIDRVPHVVEVGLKKYHIVVDQRNAKREITFFNGSRIKFVGATGVSVEALRGCEPHGVVYEEYKDHDPKFHEAMSPNYMVYNAKLLIIGTPPAMEDIESGEKRFYKDMMDYCERFDDCRVYSLSSLHNPMSNIQDSLKRERDRLYSLGPVGIAYWEREYEGKLVYGGHISYFPQFGENDLVDHHIVERELSLDPKRYKFVTFFEPGGTYRWGALMVAIDMEGQKHYILGASTLNSNNMLDSSKFTHSIFFDQAMDLVKTVSPAGVGIDSWDLRFDSLHSDFKFNIVDRHPDIWVSPVSRNKKQIGKLEGYSIIRDLKLNNKIIISDRAKELLLEFKSIRLDHKGIPIERYDELTTCLRHIVNEYDIYLRPLRQDRDPYEGLSYFEKLEKKLKTNKRTTNIDSVSYDGFNETLFDF